MHTLLTEEQRQLAAAEHAWLAKNDPIALVRAHADGARPVVDPHAIAHFRDGGYAEILTDTDSGHRDLAVLTAAHGGAASSLPVAEFAIGAWARACADSEGDGDGDATLSPVVSRFGGRFEVAEQGEELRLRGLSAPYVCANESRALVVTDDDRLVRLDTDTEGVGFEPLDTLDLTRPWSRLRLDVTVPAEAWTRLPEGFGARIRDALAVHRALDAAAAAETLVRRTVEYAGQRAQFGAPIGSFQAVKHHCANMTVGVEAARATLAVAVDALAEPDAEARHRPVAAAIAYAADAASTVASTAQQVHGGIGFTWEHDLHLFLRRIKVAENIDGTVRQRRRALVPA